MVLELLLSAVFTQRPALLPGAVAGWRTMPLPVSQWVSTDLSLMVPSRFCPSRLTDLHGFMLPCGPCFDRMEAEYVGLGQGEKQPVGSLGVGGQEARWFALSGRHVFLVQGHFKCHRLQRYHETDFYLHEFCLNCEV